MRHLVDLLLVLFLLLSLSSSAHAINNGGGSSSRLHQHAAHNRGSAGDAAILTQQQMQHAASLADDAHDHSSNSDGASSHSSSPHSMMSSAFFLRMHGSTLFTFLDLTTDQSYILFCFALTLACVMREYMHVMRMRVEKVRSEIALLRAATLAGQASLQHVSAAMSVRIDGPHLHRSSASSSSTSSRYLCCLSPDICSSLLYSLNMALAYLIMLVVMTFDGVFFLVIIVSSGVAHYVFQRRESAAAAMHGKSSSSNLSTSPHLAGSRSINSSPRLRRREETGDDEEHEALTPSLRDHGDVLQTRASSDKGSGSSSAFSEASSKKAALQLGITRDCCES